MIKKFKSLFLMITIMILLLQSSILTQASEIQPQKEVYVTEEYALSQNRLRYGESSKSTILKTEYHTKTVTPSGQPSGGNRVDGFIFINASSGPTISATIGASWGPVSVSVDLGTASTNNIGGVAIRTPNSIDYFIAKIDHCYKIDHVKVDMYQYGQYQYSYLTTHTKLYSSHSYLVKA